MPAGRLLTGAGTPPLVIDVRRTADFTAADSFVAGALDLAPQSSGLVALSLGLSRLFRDDHEMLARGMTMYDALYLWCREGQSETHTWNPQTYR